MQDAEGNAAYMEAGQGTFSGRADLEEADLSIYSLIHGLWPGKVSHHLFSQLQSP